MAMVELKSTLAAQQLSRSRCAPVRSQALGGVADRGQPEHRPFCGTAIDRQPLAMTNPLLFQEGRTIMQIPIIALQPTDRARIEMHLLALPAEDRSRRFSAGLVTDDTIRRYVAGLRFERDMVMGLVSKRGAVISLAHGCVFEANGQRHVEAAFSVDAEWRGHGFGSRLMGAVVLRTGVEGGAALLGTCAVRNVPMRRIFERVGMALRREEDEFTARGRVEPMLPVCRTVLDEASPNCATVRDRQFVPW
jgi:GNAT superfamily N-acetyltransferase